MTALLDIRRMHIEYHHDGSISEAVRGIDLQLRRGETLGIVGESGSGKSSVALGLLGLLGPNGRIAADRLRFDGIDLLAGPRRGCDALRGRRIGIVFQEPLSCLHPMQTIGRQIGEVLRLHCGAGRRTARARVIELLAEVGIDAPQRRVDAYPHQLSGGQRQRAMIAQAIAAGPDLLIADEPTTALDPATRRQVLALLQALQRQTGMAMLLVSHDLALIGEVADQLLVMRDGVAVESGPTRDLLASPRERYTQALLACRPRARTECRRLPTVAEFEVPIAQALVGSASVAVSDLPQPHRIDLAAKAAPTGGGSPSGDCLLEVRDLFVRHRDGGGLFGHQVPTPVLEGVSLSLARGRTLALLGASGSGKTTLGRAVLRLIEAESGVVRLDGTDVLGASAVELRALRRRMQIVFQDPAASLDPQMTIAALLAEPLAVHRLAGDADGRRERCVQLLQDVGLDPAVMDRYPHEFSGGQRQRIAIARALAVEPALIVCDECVSALDLSVQAQVMNLLRDLQDSRGIAYLFITHDIDAAAFMADEIAVLDGGRIIECGPAEPLLRAPSAAATRALLAGGGQPRAGALAVPLP